MNVGCGGRRIDGYTGVDAIERPSAEIIARADAIPLPDESCDEILAVHLFEHFYRWQCEGVLAEWMRLLKVGGLLALELPNLLKCCENVIDGRMKAGKEPDQLTLWGLYGDPRTQDDLMAHRWGWTPQSIREILWNCGFREISQEPPQWHPAGMKFRDMRITARKPA